MTKAEDKNHSKGDTYLNQVSESFLKIFCDKIFPGADFKYVRTRGKKHCFQYVPAIAFLGTKKFDNHKSLWLELDENLLDFSVQEHNDLTGIWGFHTSLKYNKMLPYNIYLAYKYLESIGAIEHHVVDKILQKPYAVPLVPA